MVKVLHSFLKDEVGASLIEYLLLATCIAMVVIIAAMALGIDISCDFYKSANALGANVQIAGCTCTMEGPICVSNGSSSGGSSSGGGSGGSPTGSR